MSIASTIRGRSGIPKVRIDNGQIMDLSAKGEQDKAIVTMAGTIETGDVVALTVQITGKVVSGSLVGGTRNCHITNGLPGICRCIRTPGRSIALVDDHIHGQFHSFACEGLAFVDQLSQAVQLISSGQRKGGFTVIVPAGVSGTVAGVVGNLGLAALADVVGVGAIMSFLAQLRVAAVYLTFVPVLGLAVLPGSLCLVDVNNSHIGGRGSGVLPFHCAVGVGHHAVVVLGLAGDQTGQAGSVGCLGGTRNGGATNIGHCGVDIPLVGQDAAVSAGSSDLQVCHSVANSCVAEATGLHVDHGDVRVAGNLVHSLYQLQNAGGNGVIALTSGPAACQQRHFAQRIAAQCFKLCHSGHVLGQGVLAGVMAVVHLGIELADIIAVIVRDILCSALDKLRTGNPTGNCTSRSLCSGHRACS